MGSAETGEGTVDCSAGSIVWVRRRNGSWWPGKIVGPDELSASNLMSPRSGTPVKLLGREDASVDWYNLEKSKRVKAFRCGDFDDFIERAEAYQGMAPKRREKYARRDDAIIHALELERQLLEKNYGKVGYFSIDKCNKTSDVKLGLEASPKCLEHVNGKQLLSGLPQDSNCPFSLGDKRIDHHLYADNAKHVNNLWGSENSVPGVFKTSTDSISDCGLPTETLAKDTGENFLNKRKRSHDSLGEASLAKRRDRRRPILQVLQSSLMAPVHHSSLDVSTIATSAIREEDQADALLTRRRCPNLTSESDDSWNDKELHVDSGSYHSRLDLSEDNSSGSTECTETDSSETDSLGSDTDDDDDDDVNGFSDGAASIELQPKYLGRSGVQAEHESMSSEDLDEIELADDISRPFHNYQVSTATGVSKWQLKGKRNHRRFLNRSEDRYDLKLSRRPVQATSSRGDSSDEADLVYKNDNPHIAGHESRNLGPRRDINSWDDLTWNDQPSTSVYWEGSTDFFNPLYQGHRRSNGSFMLVDVDLRVQSNYAGRHVPLISLTSKIDGRAIVGHPIQVEALEYGSYAAIHNICSGSLDNDMALQATWRTARRTANFRVPRSHPTPALNLKHVSRDQKLTFNMSNGGNFAHGTSMIRKSNSHSPAVTTFLRKSPKKTSLSSNRKIRTLSSIASQQKQSNNDKSIVSNYLVGSLIRREALSTAVACIPIKLVFSRLHEKLVGRHL